MVSQAVILAGGLGSRLGSLTQTTPKPLIEVGGTPFLDHLVWNLARHGIDSIVIAASYLSDQFFEYVRKCPHKNVEFNLVIEKHPLGTGGALRNCIEQLRDQFFVLNGDTLFDINYHALTAAIENMVSCNAAIALRSVDDVGRYGKVALDVDGVITDFNEKAGSGPGLINAGVYLLSRQHVAAIREDDVVSLESEVLPLFVADRTIAGVPFDGYFIDIGLPDTLTQAAGELANWRCKPIAFLDRDGVLNVDTGYVHKESECEWIQGAKEAVRLLNESGYLVILVTNQAGIGRGYYDEQEFGNFMYWFCKELTAEGAHIDDVFYSPFHPDKGVGRYRKDSYCRKPNPGMLLAAMEKWPHKKSGCFLIGDKRTDLEAALKAGIKGHLFTGGDLRDFVERNIQLESKIIC